MHNGKLVRYEGAYVPINKQQDTDTQDSNSDEFDDDDSSVGEKRTSKPQQHRQYLPKEWKDIVPWIVVQSTLKPGQVCKAFKGCRGCCDCSAMFCELCVERGTPAASGTRGNPFAKGGQKSFRIEAIENLKKHYHLSDLDKKQLNMEQAIDKAITSEEKPRLNFKKTAETQPQNEAHVVEAVQCHFYSC
jgi:hypothetical protein